MHNEMSVDHLHKDTSMRENKLAIIHVQLSYAHYYYSRLADFFQDNLGKPAPERQNHSGF